ncbi:alpha/beta hydrolase [Jiella avicenniae]|uniref:Alpha/beta hydrolase n=1 Tax=Jiella avicenniae TaxID=2907202 RepID=A0A9X1P1D9_9HYPH|nr:alpha/beta hydrolase [Jiella avicenniae]MCE7027706.1 alpha/beta hydrolase [Jiella avicenniae]MCE7028748.1 alpha/beta hydrolase [Jiella avicenniae]
MSGTEPAPAPQDVWAKLSQAERDAAYDNNAAVKNSADLVAARDRASTKLRGTYPAKLDLSYGGKERMLFDLYPAADPNAPCLVFIHGGYWQKNSREVFAAYAEGPLEAGWSVAMPSHTLAPHASLTDIVAEIGDALDWIAREGRMHGIGGPIVLAGWSAGAQLTAMLLGHSSVVAGLAVSGVYELGPIRDTYLNEALKLTDREIETLSPLRLPVTRKPLAVAYGSREVPALVHDAMRLHAKRAAAGAPGPLIAIEGADHFTILDELRSPSGRLVAAATELLPEGRRPQGRA